MTNSNTPPRPQPSCPACPYIRDGKTIRIGNSTWNIISAVNWELFNIGYIIECNKESSMEIR